MKDSQYNYMKTSQSCRISLGLVSNSTWDKDPKRLLFSLSMYKTVSKLLAGSCNVVEVGCGDGWNAKLVSEVVERITLTDYCPEFTDEASYNSRRWKKEASVICHNFIESPLPLNFDAAYCLDVLEHIPKKSEFLFLSNIQKSCLPSSKFIFGMPSLQSQALIPADKKDPGHVNCMTQADFIKTLKMVFNVVYPFSMNDEVLHTGHSDMSHYLLCLCAN